MVSRDKMKRIILIVFSIFVLIFTGCRVNPYPFLHDTSEICTIEIVQIDYKPDGDGNWTYTPCCAIEDKEAFLDDLSHVPCYSMAPPRDANLSSTAIKILYQNGEYELVNEHGRTKFVYLNVEAEEGEIVNRPGTVHLEAEGYNNLIDKYIEISKAIV